MCCVCIIRLTCTQANKGLRESDVTAVLKKIPVKLGAGRTTVSAVCASLPHACVNPAMPCVCVCVCVCAIAQVSLFDLLPSFCVGDLTRILEDYARSK